MRVGPVPHQHGDHAATCTRGKAGWWFQIVSAQRSRDFSLWSAEYPNGAPLFMTVSEPAETRGIPDGINSKSRQRQKTGLPLSRRPQFSFPPREFHTLARPLQGCVA